MVDMRNLFCLLTYVVMSDGVQVRDEGRGWERHVRGVVWHGSFLGKGYGMCGTCGSTLSYFAKNAPLRNALSATTVIIGAPKCSDALLRASEGTCSSGCHSEARGAVSRAVGSIAGSGGGGGRGGWGREPR